MDALVKSGRVKPADRAYHLNFAASLAGVEATFDFAAPDGTVEKLTAEERYLRELEAREPLPVAMDFSAGVTPAHVSGPAVPAYQTVDYTSKM